MAVNLYDTRTLLASGEAYAPQPSFLRDRYFPTADIDIFDTEKVDIDYKDEQNNKIAPAVLPEKGGIPVDRRGYETHEFEPPTIAPERVLTPRHLQKRQAGEALGGVLTPIQREAQIIGDDLADLTRMIDLREEKMAADTLLSNGYTIKQFADKYSSEYIEKQIKFYTGGSNPAVYNMGGRTWTTSSTDIVADLAAMAGSLTKRGLAATDVIVSGDVADIMLANSDIRELMDIRRYEMGSVKPEELPEGAVLIMVLNVKGHIMNVFSYDFEVTDESGSSALLIPSGKVIVTAPKIGRTAYGAITQINQDTNEFETLYGRRVPHVTTNAHDNVRTLTLQSKPLTIPNYKNPFITATVL